MKSIIFIFIFIFLSGFPTIFAQHFWVRDQYPINHSLINPANTGRDKCHLIKLSHKQQWLGIEQAPSISTVNPEFTFRPPHSAAKHGFGILASRDKNGPTSLIGAQISYAFHTRVSRRRRSLYMSFGIAAGYYQNTINTDDFTEGYAVGDAAVTSRNNFTPDASAGFLIYGKRIFVGLSGSNLLPVKHDYFNLTYAADDESPTAINIYGGYTFGDTEMGSFTYEPSIGYMTNLVFWTEYRGQIKAVYDDTYGAALGFKYLTDKYNSTVQSPIISLFFQLSENVQCSYHFEYEIGSIVQHYGSHSIGLRFRVCPVEPIKCPSF